MEKAIKIECPNEVDFQKMFENIGNAHAQEVIRQLNPQPKDSKVKIHCNLLKKNPSACNDVPLPGGGRGICPSNPHHPNKIREREKKLESMKEKLSQIKFDEETTEWINATGMRVCFGLLDGVIRDYDSVTPLEYVLGSFFKRKQEFEDKKSVAEYTAKLIAAFAFGGKI